MRLGPVRSSRCYQLRTNDAFCTRFEKWKDGPTASERRGPRSSATRLTSSCYFTIDQLQTVTFNILVRCLVWSVSMEFLAVSL